MPKKETNPEDFDWDEEEVEEEVEEVEEEEYEEEEVEEEEYEEEEVEEVEEEEEEYEEEEEEEEEKPKHSGFGYHDDEVVTEEEDDIRTPVASREDDEYEEEEYEDVWKNGPKKVSENISPDKCYIHSFKKEGVGRFLKKTKLKVTWELCIEGEEHTIAVYHSQLSGKKVVVFDGDVIHENEEVFDSGLWFEFPMRVEGRHLTIDIHDGMGEGKSVGWIYDILIDDISFSDIDKQRSMKSSVVADEDASLFD